MLGFIFVYGVIPSVWKPVEKGELLGRAWPRALLPCSQSGKATDSPVETEVQVQLAWGDPGIAPTPASLPAARQVRAPLPFELVPPSGSRLLQLLPVPPGPAAGSPSTCAPCSLPSSGTRRPGRKPAAHPCSAGSHLSFSTCQFVLGSASSRSLQRRRLPRATDERGKRWVMDSRLWENGCWGRQCHPHPLGCREGLPPLPTAY